MSRSCRYSHSVDTGVEQRRTDARDHVEGEEALRSPLVFQGRTQHEEAQHVQEEVPERRRA